MTSSMIASCGEIELINRIVDEQRNKSMKKGLGMEYIIVTHPGPQGTCCLLCSKYFHINMIMNHITSNHHGLAYCELNFEELYKNVLIRLYSLKLHELIEENLEILSKLIHSRYLIPLPMFVKPKYYDKSSYELYIRVMDGEHVSRYSDPILNAEIINAVNQNMIKIERSKIIGSETPTKDQMKFAKMKLSAAVFDAVNSSTENMQRSFQIDANFAQLMINLNSDLKITCALDEFENNKYLISALKFEAAYPNSSNILLRKKNVTAFIKGEREKIVSTQFEPGLLQNLKELTLSMMENLIGPYEEPVETKNNEAELDLGQENIASCFDKECENGTDIREQQAEYENIQEVEARENDRNRHQQQFQNEAQVELLRVPFVYADNSQVRLELPEQVVDIYANVPLPYYFWTSAYNSATRLLQFFFAQRYDG